MPPVVYTLCVGGQLPDSAARDIVLRAVIDPEAVPFGQFSQKPIVLDVGMPLV